MIWLSNSQTGVLEQVSSLTELNARYCLSRTNNPSRADSKLEFGVLRHRYLKTLDAMGYGSTFTNLEYWAFKQELDVVEVHEAARKDYLQIALPKGVDIPSIKKVWKENHEEIGPG